MSVHEVSNAGGTLYVVATPIGNLEDITLRALRVLAEVELIAAEDTRHSRRLLDHHGIATRLTALHEHNERRAMGRLIERIMQGESVALISDAGTPLISDPGYPLVREAWRKGVRVVPLPGASALLAALSVAGLPVDGFCFSGFLARSPGARRAQLEAVLNSPKTQIFYESSHRIVHALRDMREVLGEERLVVVCRELTKQHEQIMRAQVGRLYAMLENGELDARGEFVLLVGPAENVDARNAEGRRVLRILLDEGLPVRQAAGLAARISGGKKNRLYRLALEIGNQ